MLKTFRVTAELYFDASHIETVDVKSHTKRKASKFAKDYFHKKYPNIMDMIIIQDISEV